MRRLFIAFLALAIPATASFAPGFAAQVLVRESTAIVIGKVEYLSSTPTTETFSGLQVPAKEYFARVNVEQVLKGGPDLLRSVSLHWNILLPPADSAYESPPDGRHMLLFLKADELPNTYTFASRYYPGVFVGSSDGTPNTDSGPRDSSDEQITHRVVERMCRFVESAREDEQERVLQLGQLWSSKDPVVHDTAAKLVHDSNPKLQAAALFTLLRAKDASYHLMAREEILKAASGSGNTESARNLVLAITQEFPAAESMSVLKAGALGNNTELRTTIAYAARSTRSADAIPILLPLVDDPDGEVAWNAMHSLGELAEHLDWRPTSRESAEWQRCLNLWHEYAAGKP